MSIPKLTFAICKNTNKLLARHTITKTGQRFTCEWVYECRWTFHKASVKMDIWIVYHHHHHHIVLAARISLILSRHSSLSFIALGRSSGQHPVSSHSCWMYVRAGRPDFARPCVGIHKSTSLMSSSLLLQQCPACLVHSIAFSEKYVFFFFWYSRKFPVISDWKWPFTLSKIQWTLFSILFFCLFSCFFKIRNWFSFFVLMAYQPWRVI